MIQKVVPEIPMGGVGRDGLYIGPIYPYARTSGVSRCRLYIDGRLIAPKLSAIVFVVDNSGGPEVVK